MISIPSVSVIIPSNHDHSKLINIVNAVATQTSMPYEIIIVDSSNIINDCPKEIRLCCSKLGIKLVYECVQPLMPGEARNIGLNLATGDLIAFIDVQTIPRAKWLEASLNTISKNNVLGVFGATNFVAEKVIEKIIRDSFYGILPRRTLPGSVFKRELFIDSGRLISWVRAGEDTEWMLRLETLKLPVAYSTIGMVDYLGLLGMDLRSILKKWYRNYSASYDLPHLYPQKLFLWIFLYPLIIFIAFNWNYLIANWREDSPLYIGHITKMAAVFPLITYFLMRGIVLPLKRGVAFFDVLPYRFIAIASVGFMADVIKAYVFTIPRRKLSNQSN